jgi:hypothetical protein
MYTDTRDQQDMDKLSRVAVGFFVSPKGIVLTAAHQIPTTHPIYTSYQSDDGTSCVEWFNIQKRDTELDLVLLAPARPVSPVKFLRPDLEHSPKVGQNVAVVTSFGRCEKDGEMYPATGMLPATVYSVLHKGLFATNIYAFTGISGSPVVDPATERVLGVCLSRDIEIEFVKHRLYPFPLPDGTTVSMPVPYLITNYGIARSLIPVREFLSDLESRR